MKRTYFFIAKGIGSLLNISGHSTSGNYKYKTPVSDRLALNSYAMNAWAKMERSFNNDR